MHLISFAEKKAEYDHSLTAVKYKCYTEAIFCLSRATVKPVYHTQVQEYASRWVYNVKKRSQLNRRGGAEDKKIQRLHS